jgi:GDP-mannose 4,6-dehydratase
VNIPISNDLHEFASFFSFPDFSHIFSLQQIQIIITLAIVASLESLLSIEAADKIDPMKRFTPPNRELVAQGVGNIVSGGIGGLPVTAVIVRSSANVSAGAKTKIYQASTSELFGSTVPPQNEISEMIPQSPYAVAKLYAHNIARVYREAYGIHVSTGILFNHESPRRSRTFVTRKISTGVAEIVRGERDFIYLGNLESKRDWGFAPEYTDAMWRILQLDEPTDLVISTDKQFSVRDFCQFAFEHAGLNWQDYVKTSSQFMRPLEVESLMGDSSKARLTINWSPKIFTPELAKIMVESDLKTKNYQF